MLLHYKNCGLDNIWLVNGFNIRQTPYGTVTSYTNVDGLYLTIALELCQTKHAITRNEFRFLRKQLNLTQAELGNKLGYADQTIAKWEKGTLNIPVVAAQYLRLLCLSKFNPNLSLGDAITQTPQKRQSERIVLEHIDGAWRVQGDQQEIKTPAIRTLPQYIFDLNVLGAIRKTGDKYEKSRFVKTHSLPMPDTTETTSTIHHYANPSRRSAVRRPAIQKGTNKYANEKSYH